MLVSKYGLDCKALDEIVKYIKWEASSLRKWLNGSFLNTAFNPEEKKMIISVPVNADTTSIDFASSTDSDTDKIFLLSDTQAYKCFKSNYMRQCQGTAYCNALGVHKGDNGNCWWWLRSAGRMDPILEMPRNAFVSEDGSIFDYAETGCQSNPYTAVRPALWISLESLTS